MDNRTREFRPSERLIELAEEFSQRVRDGEGPTVEEYAQRHPEIQEEIRRYLPILEPGSSTKTLAAEDVDLPIATDILPVGVHRYHVKALVGNGSMGAVYMAHDLELDRSVALKIPRLLHAQTLDRFYREARAMATVDHPNVCSVFDVGEFAEQDVDDASLSQLVGRPYLTMAYVEGTNLAAKRCETWSAVDAARLVCDVASALQAAHEAGVVHRDVKPSNILIDRNGDPVVTDFGLARRDLPSEVDITFDGQMIGSPAYMSPEQINCQRNIGPPADIYSLGVVLYELVCGQRPFTGSPLTLLRDICWKEPPSPKAFRGNIDRDVEAICLKAISKNPSERYATAAAFATDLQAYLDGRQVSAPQPRPKWRAGMLIGILVPLLLTGLVFATQSYWNGTPPASTPTLAPSNTLVAEFQQQVNPIIFEHYKTRSREAGGPDIALAYAGAFQLLDINPLTTAPGDLSEFLATQPSTVCTDIVIGLEGWLLCALRETEDVPVPWLRSMLDTNHADHNTMRRALRGDVNVARISTLMKQFQVKHYDPRMSVVWSLYLQGLSRQFQEKPEQKATIRELDKDRLFAAHAIFPNDPYLNAAVGWRKRVNTNNEGAIPHLESAVQQHPSSGICTHLAIAYTNRGRHAEAISSAKQAITLDDSYGTAHSVLGKALFFDKQFDAAEAALEQALARDVGRRGQTLALHARVKLAKGRMEEAMLSAEGAFQLYQAEGSWQSIAQLSRRLLDQFEQQEGRRARQHRYALVKELFRASKEIDGFHRVRRHVTALLSDLNNQGNPNSKEISELKRIRKFLDNRRKKQK